jgi:hypothetical protein
LLGPARMARKGLTQKRDPGKMQTRCSGGCAVAHLGPCAGDRLTLDRLQTGL